MLTELVADPTGLRVTWSDGGRSLFPWLWLRDHAHEPETFHPVTQQRQLHTAALPPDLRGERADSDDYDVTITWAQGGSSSLPIEFLARHRVATAPAPHATVEPVVWDRDVIASAWPTIGYDVVTAGDAGVEAWLTQVARYGFCIVTGVPTEVAATEALLRTVGYVRATIFGTMWDFQADLAKADTAYTTLELLPHTDGTYSHDAPGLQLLHCLAFDGEGGESTMVDGLRIALDLQEHAPEHFRTLSSVVVPGQYIGDGAHLVAARPVFRHDHAGRLVQVSFNNYDRAPFLLPPDEMTAFYDALREFERLANDPGRQWRRVLRPGDAVLFDNWRVLHGRAAYSGHRHMAGGYVNREDFESRLRTLGSSGTAD